MHTLAWQLQSQSKCYKFTIAAIFTSFRYKRNLQSGSPAIPVLIRLFLINPYDAQHLDNLSVNYYRPSSAILAPRRMKPP